MGELSCACAQCNTTILVPLPDAWQTGGGIVVPAEVSSRADEALALIATSPLSSRCRQRRSHPCGGAAPSGQCGRSCTRWRQSSVTFRPSSVGPDAMAQRVARRAAGEVPGRFLGRLFR
jgi:hypothetical protein